MDFILFGQSRRLREDIDREVTVLITRYGDQAYEAALAAINRPNLRSRRKRVLKAAARALAPRGQGLFRRKPNDASQSQSSPDGPRPANC